ncbi:hypothetical protein K439DRAFT_682148 [Ramaria rubella]|nr:hypothetical protein K439DRAFT_682148 [Ramaria rubella]
MHKAVTKLSQIGSCLPTPSPCFFFLSFFLPCVACLLCNYIAQPEGAAPTHALAQSPWCHTVRNELTPGESQTRLAFRACYPLFPAPLPSSFPASLTRYISGTSPGCDVASSELRSSLPGLDPQPVYSRNGSSPLSLYASLRFPDPQPFSFLAYPPTSPYVFPCLLICYVARP